MAERSPKYKILMCTSEAAPYAKTGGLADAVPALSMALAKLGHEVRIVMPRYYGINRSALEKIEGAMGVPTGGGEEWCAVYKTDLGGTFPEVRGKANPVPVYFIDHEGFFGRDGIYGSPWEPDFLDNPRRFAFFCRSCFQVCRKTGWYPDVIHAHDWPAALAPVFLRYGERYGAAGRGEDPGETGSFARTVSVLTIHNLGYQGIYSKDNFFYTSLGWDVFYQAGFDDWNMMNFLKAGITTADKLNTVSPGYARETLSPAQGFRRDGDLRCREKDYSGILNGIDTVVWNPRLDCHIPVPYSSGDPGGKTKAKETLQRIFGLPERPEIPLIGMVCRLTEQKGIGALFGPGSGSAWAICRDMDLQFVFLGSGDAWAEQEIRGLASRLSNFRARIGYSEELSHLIEAGSDFFLMPSLYEPCGLNQMYSLVYGTLPIVRNTGGLADTVQNYDQNTGKGTGFMFNDLTPEAVYNTVGWAVWAWYNRPEDITAMRRRGMDQDFSWNKSAQRYAGLYASALAGR
ncbi:MAG: glycogen synthase [Treponema sp.]|jgi:starch synthase|nr:glycogen synthase [Treponema sp.]